MLDLTLHGATLTLRPDGSLLWADAGLLVIADPHFGKDEVFRRSGIAVPCGPTLLDFERVSAALDATGARRLRIVGDFLHASTRDGDDLPRQFALWRRRHAEVHFELVTGNHDRHEDWDRWRGGLEVVRGSVLEGPFVFAHEPEPDARGYVIGGHVHPVYGDRLSLGTRALRVFWRRRGCLVLPSWGEFTGGWRVSPARDEGLYACTPDGVLVLQTGRPT